MNWDAIGTSLTGNDTDPEGDSLSVTNGPTGTEWIAAGTSRDYVYTISDGHGGTSSAHVRVSVELQPNQAPTAVNDVDTITIGHNEEYAWIDWSEYLDNVVRNNDTDPDGNALTVTNFTGPTGESVRYDVVTTYTYTISDGQGGSAQATITVSVNRPNEKPVAADDDLTIQIGHNDEWTQVDWMSYLQANALGNDTDADNDTLTIEPLSGPSSETLSPGQTRSISYTVNDGHGGTDTATANVTVTRPNQNPTASGYSDVMTIGRDETGTDVDWDYVRSRLGAVDADGDSLTIEGSSGTERLAVGTTTRTFTISDGHGGTVSVDASITVENEENQQPTAADDTYNLTEFSTLMTVAPGVLENDRDPEGDQLTVVNNTQPEHGSVTVNGDGSFTYSPGPTFDTDDQFTYTLSDGHGGSATATVYIHYNRPPIAADDEYDVWGGETTVIPAAGVLANDRGAYDGTKQIIVFPANRTEHGYVTLYEDGSFTYTPDAGYYDDDSFEYRLAGGGGTKDNGIVTLHVQRPPHANDDEYAMIKGSVLESINDQSIGDNDTGTFSSYVLISGPAYGEFTFDSQTGAFTYVAGSEGLDDEFTYALAYGDGLLSNVATTQIKPGTPKLELVTFENTISGLYADDGTYEYRHWEDKDAPGAPGDGTDSDGDMRSGIVEVAGTTIKTSIKLQMDKSILFTDLQIRGTLLNGTTFNGSAFTFDFGSGAMKSLGAGTYITTGDLESVSRLPEFVGKSASFKIKWEVSDNKGASWSDAGISSNRLYVLLNEPPLTEHDVYETVVSLAVEAMEDRCDPLDPETIAMLVFHMFTEFNLHRVSDGGTITYYENWSTKLDNVKDLLAAAKPDGKCGAMNDLFQAVLRLLRVSTFTDVTVTVKDSAFNELVPLDQRGLLVKNWIFGDPSSADPKGYSYYAVFKPDDNPNEVPRFTPTYGSLCDDTGVTGQGGVENPKAYFRDHALTKVGNVYYDPSYGRIYSDPLDFQTQSLDGVFASDAVSEQDFNIDFDGDGVIRSAIAYVAYHVVRTADSPNTALVQFSG